MNYICTEYYLLLFLTLILYYIIPKGKQWIALLIGSAVFYCLVSTDIMQLCLFLATIILSFLGALLIERSKEGKQRLFMLWAVIILTAAPLLLYKGRDFLPAPDTGRFSLSSATARNPRPICSCRQRALTPRFRSCGTTRWRKWTTSSRSSAAIV